MSIQADLDELSNIDYEIKRLKATLQSMKQQRDTVEQRVIQFLKSQEQPGVRYQGKAVLLDVKKRTHRKKKLEKEADMASVLKDYGVRDAEHALRAILNVQRGNAVEADTIKIYNHQK
jgi:seryl-tRNA synthetase